MNRFHKIRGLRVNDRLPPAGTLLGDATRLLDAAYASASAEERADGSLLCHVGPAVLPGFVLTREGDGFAVAWDYGGAPCYRGTLADCVREIGADLAELLRLARK